MTEQERAVIRAAREIVRVIPDTLKGLPGGVMLISTVEQLPYDHSRLPPGARFTAGHSNAVYRVLFNDTETQQVWARPSEGLGNVTIRYDQIDTVLDPAP